MILHANDILGPVKEHADVCIIGSGCGGGASAKVLSEAGKKVIVLEEGGSFTHNDFDMTEQTAYTNLYQQRAGQATDDLSVTVLQGKCVGGSSTVNWTTSLRTPEFVLDAWRKNFGVKELSANDLEPYFDRIEKYLNVHIEPEQNHNPNNRIILTGAKKLGYHARATGRNTDGCIKSGACGLGCPFDAKRSVDVTYIPDAEKAGAMIFPNFRADKIDVGGKSKHVRGMILDQTSRQPRYEFDIEAPIVIVSASAIHSPALLLKSGIANSSGHVGKHLTFHLTSAVVGIFDDVIYPAGGIPQSAMCDEFLNKNNDGGGYWIEAVPVYPALAALSLPGFGDEHHAMMKEFLNIGASIVLVKEIDSEGAVTVNGYGRPSISYSAGPIDRAYMKQGVKTAAKIHFAAGAKKVMTLHTTPTFFSSPSEIDPRLENAHWGSNEITLFSAHPLGTCRMGEDARNAVVNSHCESHDVPGLFVIDGSVTPTSLGVNPQITILAIAEKSAEWIAGKNDSEKKK
jgi:choline dehydrogenase-like flavoprotein